MSRENVELVRGLYEEWAEGRLGAGLDLFAPDVEYARASSGGAGTGLSGTWYGLEEMSRAMKELLEPFAAVRFVGERYLDAGDSVVVFNRFTGTAKASGIPVERRAADVLTIQDGRVVRFRQYLHRHEALEAVGLRE